MMTPTNRQQVRYLIAALAATLAIIVAGSILWLVKAGKATEAAQQETQAVVGQAIDGKALADGLTAACESARIPAELAGLCEAAKSLADQPAAAAPTAAALTTMVAITGPPGPIGMDGRPGTPGKDGADGINGTGVAGSDGANGVNGQNGANGTGVPGPAGADGASGTVVILGEDGADSTVPGPVGAAGADSTVPGPAGAPGSPGADSTVPGPIGPQGRGLATVECLADGTWQFVLDDQTKVTVAGPCRAVVATVTETATPITETSTEGP